MSCQYIVNKNSKPIDFGYNMLYLYRLLRLNIGSKRQAPGNRSMQSHAPCTVRYRAGRLPKTERMMSNNQAAQKFWCYWPSLNDLREGMCNLFAIPGKSISQGFLFARRGGQIPLPEGEPTRLRFVLFPYIKDKKQNSRGDRDLLIRRPTMHPTFLKTLLTLSLIAALAVPAPAAKKKTGPVAASASETPASPVQKEKKVKKSWEENLPDSDPEEAKTKGTQEMLEGRVSGAGYNGLAVELPNPKK